MIKRDHYSTSFSAAISALRAAKAVSFVDVVSAMPSQATAFSLHDSELSLRKEVQ